RRLAGAVWPDDQPALAGRDREIDVGGDPQAAERFVEALHGQRGHGRSPETRKPGTVARARNACQPMRQSRTEPGTRPSGMKVMMRTKITPSTMFQRTT